jgi:hypothetical protein
MSHYYSNSSGEWSGAAIRSGPPNFKREKQMQPRKWLFLYVQNRALIV